MARKLVDIEAEEISLVDRAANRKKFAIIKRRVNVDELFETLKAIYGEEEITAEVMERLRKADLPEDALNAIKGALNLLKKYLSDMPADVKDAVKALGKYASFGAPEKKDKKVEKAEELTIEKIGARLSKSTVDELRKLRDFIAGAVGGSKGLAKARDILETLLGEAIVEKKADGDENLSAETRLKLAKLEEYETKDQVEVKKAADSALLKPILDELKAMKTEVETLKKGKRVISKGLKDDKGGADGDDDKPVVDNWPSFNVGSDEEEGGAA